MFAKLLKYEWRSNAATCGILSLCALGVALLGGIGLRYLVTHASEDAPNAAVLGLSMMMAAVVLSLLAYAAAVFILQLVRFYKSRFTDEGYLTFTLPVNVHQIFGASAVNLLIWMLISGAVLIVCALVMYLFATVGLEPVDFGDIEFLEPYPDGYTLVSLLSGIASVIFGVMLPLTCLTVGACAAKKHKLLAAFGIYYGISVVMGFLEGFLSAMLFLNTATDGWENYTQMDMQQTLVTAIAQIIMAVAGYFLSTGLMKNKLNLS